MEQKRRFSLDDNFMKSRENRLLYGFMRCFSTTRPIENGQWEEYLPKSTFVKNKRIIAKLCGVTTGTIDRHVKALIKKGFIEETTVQLNNQDYICYLFPYDYGEIYKLIDKELLKFIVNTGNAFSIQVYLHLLNCSNLKKDYHFTLKELCEAFGYSKDSQIARNIIKDCLISFKNNGIIDYEEVTVEIANNEGKLVKTPNKVLKYIAIKAPYKITQF